MNAVGGLLARKLIMAMVRRTDRLRVRPITPWSSDIRPMKRLANRYMPLWRDEIQYHPRGVGYPLPWYAPFNVLLHHWLAHDDGIEMHDHPRWSVTICLKGEMTEITPWGERRLKAGSVVFRSSRYIHGFRIAPEHSARTWTLFIVGRRRAAQNTYVITRRTQRAIRGQA